MRLCLRRAVAASASYARGALPRLINGVLRANRDVGIPYELICAGDAFAPCRRCVTTFTARTRRQLSQLPTKAPTFHSLLTKIAIHSNKLLEGVKCKWSVISVSDVPGYNLQLVDCCVGDHRFKDYPKICRVVIHLGRDHVGET
ncbi:hypothetical protein ACJJTC_007127 [Scirpophaga incertulas]